MARRNDLREKGFIKANVKIIGEEPTIKREIVRLESIVGDLMFMHDAFRPYVLEVASLLRLLRVADNGSGNSVVAQQFVNQSNEALRNMQTPSTGLTYESLYTYFGRDDLASRRLMALELLPEGTADPTPGRKALAVVGGGVAESGGGSMGSTAAELAASLRMVSAQNEQLRNRLRVLESRQLEVATGGEGRDRALQQYITRLVAEGIGSVVAEQSRRGQPLALTGGTYTGGSAKGRYSQSSLANKADDESDGGGEGQKKDGIALVVSALLARPGSDGYTYWDRRTNHINLAAAFEFERRRHQETSDTPSHITLQSEHLEEKEEEEEDSDTAKGSDE